MTLKDKPSDIFGIILLTPEELETGAGACTETVEIGYFIRFFNFCAFLYLYTGRSGNYFRGLQALSFIRFHFPTFLHCCPVKVPDDYYKV